MALWRYEIEQPDGARTRNVLAAGNQAAALKRAEQFAAARGGRLVGNVEAVDPVRGSM